MRLGGPVKWDGQDPQQWAEAVKALGYSAAFCPVGAEASDDLVAAVAEAARRNDIVIAEVGAWSNPLSGDPATRAAAHDKCVRQLALAERIGARCCVNIAGSRGAKWDGPCELDLTDETFEMIVQSVRAILDAVQPTRTFYTLETMPWMYPDSPDSYLRLIRAVDRPAFAVHLDPVNLVCSPQRYFDNAALLRECFARLGPRIKSCHAKDTLLHGELTVRLEEVVPGRGRLDYRVFLRELSHLPGDVPLLLEHLRTPEDYAAGAAHIRRTAEEIGVCLRKSG
ncbi:MAG TPA: xylose isomerase [Phycisphaerales bacterium]|nr:xylose isomerase [Phycisphaerales bacterium]